MNHDKGHGKYSRLMSVIGHLFSSRPTCEKEGGKRYPRVMSDLERDGLLLVLRDPLCHKVVLHSKRASGGTTVVDGFGQAGQGTPVVSSLLKDSTLKAWLRCW